MKTALRFCFTLMILTMALPALADSRALEDYGAGRIRYVEGSDVQMVFARQTLEAREDFLVLVGATFHTNDGRVEFQTLGGNLFWMDSQTDFHFEASDPSGDQTAIFLARGSFVVQTRVPMTVITGAGSIFLPAEGSYCVSKAKMGNRKTTVSILSGPKAEIIKFASRNSTIKLDGKRNDELVSWVGQRTRDWERTLTRARLFSHVVLEPPAIAYTDRFGQLHWRWIDSVRKVRNSSLVSDSWFDGDSPCLRPTAALLTFHPLPWSDPQILMWFAQNNYTAVRWAWDVARGWHAEGYFDPLAGFSSRFYLGPLGPWDLDDYQKRLEEYVDSYLFTGTYWGLAYHGRYWEYVGNSKPADPSRVHLVQTNEGEPVPVAGPSHTFNIQAPLAARTQPRLFVRLTEDSRLSERVLNDRRLKTPSRAARLDVERIDIRRAMERSRGPSVALTREVRGGRNTSRIVNVDLSAPWANSGSSGISGMTYADSSSSTTTALSSSTAAVR